jgi:hypothetical protein
VEGSKDHAQFGKCTRKLCHPTRNLFVCCSRRPTPLEHIRARALLLLSADALHLLGGLLVQVLLRVMSRPVSLPPSRTLTRERSAPALMSSTAASAYALSIARCRGVFPGRP